MRLSTRVLAAILLSTTPLPAAHPVARASANAPAAAATAAAQAGGGSEREQGRALLRRGKAAEALIHFERALKAFRQAGDKGGEASTLDLMGAQTVLLQEGAVEALTEALRPSRKPAAASEAAEA